AARLVGVCLALPGLVDRGSGPLRLAPNLGWADVDVVGALGPVRLPGSIGLDPRARVELANEATLGARAEVAAVQRLARTGRPSFLYVSGEVGIGAAIVHEGTVFDGQRGWSGELGHTAVDPTGRRCACGALGCLETVAGKDALYRAAGMSPDAPVEDLVEHAADPRVGDALDVAGAALGLALANFVNLVDVREVVLGGMYRPLTPLLHDPVTQVLGARVVSARWAPVTVRQAYEDSWAALTGAARAALAGLVREPADWLGVHPGDGPAGGRRQAT